MTGRATPAADPGDDTAPPVRRAPQAGGGEVTNGAELLEALTVAVRRAGFKELEDLLAGKTGTRYERIREELAEVCKTITVLDAGEAQGARITADYVVGLGRERDEALSRLKEAEAAILEERGRLLRRLHGASIRLADGSVGDADIIGWPDIAPARPPVTNLERVTVAAARGDGEFAEAFAWAAKETR